MGVFSSSFQDWTLLTFHVCFLYTQGYSYSPGLTLMRSHWGPTPSGKMNNCSTARLAHASGSYAQCDQMSKKLSNANHVSPTAQNRDCKNGQGPGQVPAHRQEHRVRSFSTVSASSEAPRSHQQRSAEFCKCGTSPIITMRKNKKEPQPPQRSISLLQPKTACHPSFKRYSCPPIGICSPPSHLYSSSSSSSTSSCSSPPPVQTSVITGPDPRGWKLRPKSSSSSRRTNRLSLPVIFPEPKTSPVPNSQLDALNPDPFLKTKPSLRPKPSRRHSDSSAFLRSPPPVVTLDELCAVRLHVVALSDESDDVFSRNEVEVKVTPQPRKIPPPVPQKTSMAREKAQLIAHSHQSCKTNEGNIYTCVIKPKPKYLRQTEDHSSLEERQTGKHENL